MARTLAYVTASIVGSLYSQEVNARTESNNGVNPNASTQNVSSAQGTHPRGALNAIRSIK
jgi:hypothetical protein